MIFYEIEMKFGWKWSRT